MAAITEIKRAQERWEEHCRQIQSMTDTASLYNPQNEMFLKN